MSMDDRDERLANRVALAVLAAGALIAIIAFFSPGSLARGDLLRSVIVLGPAGILSIALRTLLLRHLACRRSGLSRARYLLEQLGSVDRLRRYAANHLLLGLGLVALPIAMGALAGHASADPSAATIRGTALFSVFFLPGAAYYFYVAWQCFRLVRQVNKGI